MFWPICILFIVIIITTMNPRVKERFCTSGCGETLPLNLPLKLTETFCTTGCVEGFGNFNSSSSYCPDNCSSKRYPLQYIYCQTCGSNVNTTMDRNKPYYIPPNY